MHTLWKEVGAGEVQGRIVDVAREWPQMWTNLSWGWGICKLTSADLIIVSLKFCNPHVKCYSYHPTGVSWLFREIKNAWSRTTIDRPLTVLLAIPPKNPEIYTLLISTTMLENHICRHSKISNLLYIPMLWGWTPAACPREDRRRVEQEQEISVSSETYLSLASWSSSDLKENKRVTFKAFSLWQKCCTLPGFYEQVKKEVACNQRKEGEENRRGENAHSVDNLWARYWGHSSPLKHMASVNNIPIQVSTHLSQLPHTRKFATLFQNHCTIFSCWSSPLIWNACN